MSAMTLAEFLLARIADDEAVARAVRGAPSHPADTQLWTVVETSFDGATVPLRGSVEATPTRVLAECEAKRRIVDHEIEPYYVGGRQVGRLPASPVLRLLALPYGKHPDYREEWRP